MVKQSLLLLLILIVMGAIVYAQDDEPTGYLVYTSEIDIDAPLADKDLYLLNIETGEEIQLTDTPDDIEYDPAWSPDGELIIFDGEFEYGLQLFTIRPDGTERTQLTDEWDAMSSPAWSPDGERIAYIANPNGNWSLYVMDSDTTNQERLVARQDLSGDPDWDPFIRFILFTLSEGYSGPRQLVMMDVEEDRLFSISQVAGIDGEYSYSPDWSNDGQHFVYSHRVDRDDDFDIYTMTSVGRDITNLTNNDSFESYPTWSPDDEWIAFVSDRDGQYDIYVMRRDGSDVRRLTNTEAREQNLAWRPVTDED